MSRFVTMYTSKKGFDNVLKGERVSVSLYPLMSVGTDIQVTFSVDEHDFQEIGPLEYIVHPKGTYNADVTPTPSEPSIATYYRWYKERNEELNKMVLPPKEWAELKRVRWTDEDEAELENF